MSSGVVAMAIHLPRLAHELLSLEDHERQLEEKRLEILEEKRLEGNALEDLRIEAFKALKLSFKGSFEGLFGSSRCWPWRRRTSS